jgi:hypothetical protein
VRFTSVYHKLISLNKLYFKDFNQNDTKSIKPYELTPGNYCPAVVGITGFFGYGAV